MARELEPKIMLAEWLFVETVDDIRRRSHDPGTRDRYELLGIAPLVRKLLLDNPGLLDTVRAARPDVPTNFRIKQWKASEEAQERVALSYWLRLGGPELVGGPDYPALTKLKQFVGATVGEVDGQALTVREIVRHYAHVEGGVHFGVPKEPEQLVLRKMAPLLLGRSTGQIEVLAHIGSIVVDALTPLRNSILSSPMIDTRMHHLNESGYFDGHWTEVHYAKTAGHLHK
ncbi:hypothetical protein [Glutamicibacter sp. 2E12]|uniref:hypothetical protein n=1 Tax=Glutamicibacter sp. 2E12 TaxID=3416181 RepID=UPI003CF05D4F